MCRSFKAKEVGINISVNEQSLVMSNVAGKSKMKFNKILETILLWRVNATIHNTFLYKKKLWKKYGSENFNMESGASCKTALKCLGFHVLLFNLIFHFSLMLF